MAVAGSSCIALLELQLSCTGGWQHSVQDWERLAVSGELLNGALRSAPTRLNQLSSLGTAPCAQEPVAGLL